MIEYLTLILLCQLAGEVFVSWSGWPLPGPVAGMVLMLAFLAIRGGIPETLEKVGGALLSNLSLLFVPAGVGVMLHLDRVGTEALPLAAGLFVSTAIGV
ncbi:MAG: CidA/LrgA family protein, partial [Rubricella sp.]